MEITTMGERGQIVIPQVIREHMKIEKGEKFLIVEDGTTILLKPMRTTREEFDEMLRRCREHAKKHHLTKKDVLEAIKKARAKK